MLSNSCYLKSGFLLFFFWASCLVGFTPLGPLHRFFFGGGLRVWWALRLLALIIFLLLLLFWGHSQVVRALGVRLLKWQNDGETEWHELDEAIYMTTGKTSQSFRASGW